MAKKVEGPIQIEGLKMISTRVWILGRSPLVFNSMSAKVKQGLLVGSKKKTTAERQSIKHHPFQEYNDSVYRHDDEETLLCFPGGGLRKAMQTAALETPGAVKTKVMRTVWVEEYNIPIWGIPQIWVAMVRCADMARTPDMRTRAILPEWCARVTISYVTPALSADTIASLLGNAGLVIGIGDNRQEKGAGSNGQFILAAEDDPRVAKLVAEAGRPKQIAALESPAAYDAETQSLLDFYEAEVKRREG